MLASTIAFILFSPYMAFVTSSLAGAFGAKGLGWFVGVALLSHLACYLSWRIDTQVPYFADGIISTVITVVVGFFVWKHWRSTSTELD